MPFLSFDVKGVPGAQGSKRHVGRGVMLESSKKVAPWRTDVRDSALAAMGDDWQPLTGPVTIEVTFYFPRPRSHYGTGRNAERVKDSAPDWPDTKWAGDLDKLTRAVFDSLTAGGVIEDDARVVEAAVSKVWCPLGAPGGVLVGVTPMYPRE